MTAHKKAWKSTSSSSLPGFSDVMVGTFVSLEVQLLLPALSVLIPCLFLMPASHLPTILASQAVPKVPGWTSCDSGKDRSSGRSWCGIVYYFFPTDPEQTCQDF